MPSFLLLQKNVFITLLIQILLTINLRWYKLILKSERGLTF